MLGLNKIKYSFVLCLALLFSFSFAGTIRINNVPYTYSFLSDDYVINTTSSYSVVETIDNSNSNIVSVNVTMYNDSNSINQLGLATSRPPTASYDKFTLYTLSSSPSLVSYYGSSFVFRNSNYSSYGISYYDSNGTTDLTSSDFPFTVTDFSADMGNTVSIAGQTSNYSLNINYAPFNAYAITFSNGSPVLGEQIYTSTSPGFIVYPPFSPSVSQQWIDTNVLAFLDSDVLKNQLPSHYDKFFVVYYEDTGYYQPFIFHNSYNAVGLIHFDHELDEPFYNIFLGDKITHMSDSAGLVEDYFEIEIGGNYPIYTFFKNDDNNSLVYNSFSTIPVTTFYQNTFSYDNNPVVYTNFDFPFYSINDGVIGSEPDFTLTYSPIYDSNNNEITAEGELSKPKTNDSIWSMLFNIFNPPNDSSNNMSVIEGQHQEIINGGNFNSFKSYFDYSKTLIGDLSTIKWLIDANEALFVHFSRFLILCCIFITISRVLR